MKIYLSKDTLSEVFPGGTVIICLPMRETLETWIQSLGHEDPLEEELETHSNILAWRISWTDESGRLQSMGFQRVGQDWNDWACMYILWRGGRQVRSCSPDKQDMRRVQTKGWNIHLGRKTLGGHLLSSSIFLKGRGILSLLSLDQKCHGISAW